MRHGHGVAEDDELIGRMRRSSMLIEHAVAGPADVGQRARRDTWRCAPEPFEAAALVEGVAMAARDAAHQKALALQVQLPSDPVFVVADGSRIDQVLTNLVVNSVRYTETGEVRLTLHPFDTASSQLHFTVADTGPGIPSDLLPSLLEPDKLVAPARPQGRRLGHRSGGGADPRGSRRAARSRSIAEKAKARRSTSAFPPNSSTRTHRPANPASNDRRVLIIDDREDVLTGLTSVDQRTRLRVRPGADNRDRCRTCWRRVATTRC